MTVTTFDPTDDLIIVQAYVLGARGQERELRLVVDTGAGPTIIASDILDELGYSARKHGEQVASTRSIAGREEGYMLRDHAGKPASEMTLANPLRTSEPSTLE